MDKRLMTPQEYVNANVNAYPSLYASKNPKLRIMDQLFNVIGNGVRNFEDAITKTHDHKIEKPTEKYLDGSKLFYVYTEYKTINMGDRIRKFPIGRPIDEIISEEEKSKYPDALFIECGSRFNDDKFSPYPNFNEQYSLIWTDENALSIMSDEWKAAAHSYYSAMLDFFNNPKTVYNYHHAPPFHDEDKMKRKIEEQEKMFNAKRTDDMSDADFYEMVEREWEHPYNGNTREFIIDRWEKEHQRIIDFILKTLERIEKSS